MNNSHKNFSEIIGENSLEDIGKIISLGGSIISDYKSIDERNSAIAENCDYMIVFTWKDSLDAYKKTKSDKIHISLNSLKKD